MERKHSQAKMSQVFRGMSLVMFFFISLISFGLKRGENGGVRLLVIRRTKVKKFKKVDGNDFFPIVSSSSSPGGEDQLGNNFTKEENNFSKKQKKKRARFKRIKVAPGEDKHDWPNGETYRNSSIVLPKESYKSSPYASDVPLPPPSTDSYNVLNAEEASGDQPYMVENDPGTNDAFVATHVALNLTDKFCWEQTSTTTKKKSALSKFFARFKRDGPKSSKVRKFRK